MLSFLSKHTHVKRITHGSVVAGLVATLSLPATLADEDSDKDKKDKPRGAFPTLNILPEGSILRRVRLPRYDKDFNPISLLEADQLTVLDSHRIEAEGVTVELYENDGSVQASTKMRRAIYDQKKSTLHAKEAIYVKGKSYLASGSGLIFHWETKQGFLMGPVSTLFQITKSDTDMTSLSPTNPYSVRSQACAIAGSFITLSSSLIAEPPARLTAAELAELDRLAQPIASKASASQQKTRESIAEQKQLDTEARESMIPFLKEIGQGSLLVQAPNSPATPPDQPAPPAKDVPAKPNQTTLKVECDGGLYFDNDSGILAYLKNIRLTEDRFKLTCSDELKVFLEKKADKAEEPKADATEPAKKPNNGKDKKDKSLSSFGELKQIIATGKVKVTRKDDKGNLFIATGETASYSAKTGEIILRGGFPKLQQSATQYLQAQEPGQWIRVLKNGKLITSNGKWKMLVVRKNP